MGTRTKMEPTPQVRTEGLITERLDDGLVIYDRLSGQAHSLDAAAAALWSLADGTRTVRQIARAARLEETLAQAAIERLAEAGLLLGATGISRRSILRRAAGIGAGALAAAPVIETLVIPVAAAHASVGPTQPPQPTPTPNPHLESHHPGKPIILEEPTIVDGQAGPPHHKHKKKKKKHKQPPHHPGKPLTHHHPHPKPKPKPKRKRKPPDEPEAPGTV
jgi:hypothetical protein